MCGCSENLHVSLLPRLIGAIVDQPARQQVVGRVDLDGKGGDDAQVGM